MKRTTKRLGEAIHSLWIALVLAMAILTVDLRRHMNRMRRRAAGWRPFGVATRIDELGRRWLRTSTGQWIPAIAGGMGGLAYVGSAEIGDIAVLETSDIGGTNAQAGAVDMREFANVFAYVELGTWNSSDDLDECRLEQGDGSTWKDLTTDASGGNYDTDNPIDADGDFVILEAKADDLDQTNGFYQVRLYVAEGGNSGVDNVTAFIFGWNPRDAYAERNGAAVTGSKVYVTPES